MTKEQREFLEKFLGVSFIEDKRKEVAYQGWLDRLAYLEECIGKLKAKDVDVSQFELGLASVRKTAESDGGFAAGIKALAPLAKDVELALRGPVDSALLNKAVDVIQERIDPLADAIKKLKGKIKTQKAMAEEAETRRYQRGIDVDEARRTANEASAKQDYDLAVKRVREEAAKLNEMELELSKLQGEVVKLTNFKADVLKQVKGEDFGNISSELHQAIQLVDAREDLAKTKLFLEDREQKLESNQLALAEAKRPGGSGSVELLQDAVNDHQESIEKIKVTMAAQALKIAELSGGHVDKLDKGELEARYDRLTEDAKQLHQSVIDSTVSQQAADQDVSNATSALLAVASQKAPLKLAHEKLTEAKEEVTRIRTAAREALQNIENMQEKLIEKQNQVADLVAGRLDSHSPDDQEYLISFLPQLGTMVADEKAQLREFQVNLEAAEKAEVEAEQALREGLTSEAASDAALGELLAMEKESREKLEAADKALAAADETHKLKLEEAAEVDRRAQVIAKLPDASETLSGMLSEFETLKDTPIWEGADQVKEKLGSKFPEFVEQATTLTKQYQALVEAGATTEELQNLYKDVPDKWKPPTLRREEQNWLVMKAMFTDEAVETMMAEEESSILESITSKKDIAETASSISSSLVEKLGGELDSEKVKEITEKVGTALSAAGELFATCVEGVEAAESGIKMSKTEDPVERMLLEEQFITALGNIGLAVPGIAGEVAELLGDKLLGIGIVVSGANAMKAMVETAMHVQRRSEMGEVHQQSLEQEHRGEAAFDQFKTRETHLALRSGTDTGVNMIKTAAGVADLGGPHGMAVGAALKGVATGVSLTKSGVEKMVDWTEAQKAQDLLQQAQAGNADAREELFRHHTKYAKGIISVMAIEGDPLALEAISTYGLTEQMIRKSSPKIIRKYLLSKFGEEDEPSSWTDMWNTVSGIVVSVGLFLVDAVGWLTGIKSWYLVIVELTKPKDINSRLKEYEAKSAFKGEFIKNIGQLQKMRYARDRLDTGEADAAKLKALDEKIKEATTKVDGMAKTMTENAAKIGRIHARVLKGLAKAPDDPYHLESLTITKRLVADTALLSQLVTESR